MQLNQETNLYGNYGVWHIPFWQTTSFKVSLTIISLVVLSGIIYFLVKAYFKRKAQRLLAPWEYALKELNHLKNTGVLVPEKGKIFYLSTTTIMKQYLHDRFAYDVVGKTDEETITYLKEKQFDEELLSVLEKLFSGSIIIKFANGKAAQQQMQNDFENSIFLIKKTLIEQKGVQND